jgi:hypothetical protein
LATHAQGTIFFNNRTSAGDFPIALPDGSPAGNYPGGASAQLFLVTQGGTVYTPLNPATTFRTGSAAGFYVNPVDVTVPGVAAGEPATVVIRAWASSYGSFEAAQIAGFWGQSPILTIAGLGGVNPTTGAIVPTPDLSGMGSFVLVPEPSTVALVALGAMGLFFRRRK